MKTKSFNVTMIFTYSVDEKATKESEHKFFQEAVKNAQDWSNQERLITRGDILVEERQENQT